VLHLDSFSGSGMPPHASVSVTRDNDSI